jgi:type IV pilus assembly protein PilW
MRRHQSGTTLVELMIALVIGLVVVLAGLSVYVHGAGTARLSREQSRMSADASSVLGEWGRQVRMAGFSRVRYLGTTASDSKRLEGPSIRGCNGGFVDIAAAEVTCAGGAGNDGFEIAFELDETNGRTVAGDFLDCAGQPVQRTAIPEGAYLLNAGSDVTTRAFVRNRYFIEGGKLVCVGNGGTTPYGTKVTLLTDVEDLQLDYVVQKNGAAARGDAGAVSAAYASEAEAWGAVQSVRVCLLVAMSERVAGIAAPYANCAGAIVNATDQRFRQKYEVTYALRNQIAPGI